MKKMFRYASLLAAAAMLFACEGNIDNPDEPNDPNEPGNQQPVTPPTPGGEDLELIITPDKNIVQTFGGDYIKLTVTLGENVITEGVTFYEGKTVLDIADSKYSTAVKGDHSIWANYGTYQSEKIIIRAVEVEIPETPKDTKPQSTDFKARILLNQFTTTGCQPCSLMKGYIHDALEDQEFQDKVILTACHSGLVENPPFTEDPAYIKTTLDDFYNISGFPFVGYDMCNGFANEIGGAKSLVKKLNDYYTKCKADPAGIAVTSYITDNRKLVVKATVKAAKAGAYRIGAFLCEDGIKAKQAPGSEEWMNTHDGVIRYIDSRSANSSSYLGHSVGKIEAGKVADYIFEWDLEKIWADGAKAAADKTQPEAGKWTAQGNKAWSELTVEQLKEKLHIVVFTSTTGPHPVQSNKTAEYVNNAVDCPIAADVTYEYNK